MRGWACTASRTSPLADLVALHRDLAETLARGTAAEGSGGLWEKEAGEAARAAVQALQDEAPHGGFGCRYCC